MTTKTDQIEQFKNATAATLRAMSGKRELEVTFAPGDVARPNNIQGNAPDRTRLPPPDSALSAESVGMVRGAAVPLNFLFPFRKKGP